MDGFVAGDILDVSSQPAAALVLGSTANNDRVQEAGLKALVRAYANDEVLVAWRGCIPKSLFEVIDEDSEQFVRMLAQSPDEALALSQEQEERRVAQLRRDLAMAADAELQQQLAAQRRAKDLEEAAQRLRAQEEE